jgi:hypothetical protein
MLKDNVNHRSLKFDLSDPCPMDTQSDETLGEYGHASPGVLLLWPRHEDFKIAVFPEAMGTCADASARGGSMGQQAINILGGGTAWLLAACAPAAMGPVTYVADPGQYENFSCPLLAERHKYWADRELELKLLIDKAEQSVSGGFVSAIAYQGDYVAAREELKLVDAAWREKKCDARR